MDCRFPSRLVSSVVRLGPHHNESRPSDQGSRNDESIDVGDPLAMGSRSTAVTNKQEENLITSLEIRRIRKSSERKARNGYCFPRIDPSINWSALRSPTPHGGLVPSRATTVGRNGHDNCLIRISDMTETITSADGKLTAMSEFGK